MGTHRDASAVEDTGERAQKPLLVIVKDDRVSVDMGEECGLGFQPESALAAKRAFVGKLQQISAFVGTKQPTPPAEPDEDDPAECEAWEQERKEWEQDLLPSSLRLDKATGLKYLSALQELGAGLRSDLSKEMMAKLKYSGFLDPLEPEDPALTFLQDATEAPILWDMMYEGSQAGLPDWQQFWGFRAPITHWMVSNPRIDQIRLPKESRFFSAINEELRFAGREVDLLAGRLQPQVAHITLAEQFQREVERELLEQLNNDASKAGAWWEEHQGAGWLHCYLSSLYGDEEECKTYVDKWKSKALVTICKDAFNSPLLHFACHAEAGKETELLSRLNLKVAGEPVSLSVSLLSSDLGIELTSKKVPGPLVFLNACSTAQPGESQEPPGLPEKWIRNRGALAVIATLCKVPDYFAHAFAMKFYEILLAAVADPKDENPISARNRYVAEALLATRRFFMQEYNNPLGLAYVLFAVQGAHVWADFLHMRDAP